jgi:hypothetical protein
MLPLTRSRNRQRFFAAGWNPFSQPGPTLDLSFAGVVTDLTDPNGYTLNTNFIAPQYQIAAQYVVWETNVGLVDKTFSQIITFTRASTATYFDATGTLQSAAIDVPRLDYDPATLAAQGLLIEEQRTNSIRNNTGVGAVNGVIGSGGAVPTNWTSQINTTTGLTRQVVGTGTENGIAYVDFRLSGTATGAGSFDMFFEQASVAAALTGQTWAGSVFTKLVGGTTNGLSLPRFYLYELTSGAAFITAQVLSPGFSLPATGALNTQRYAGAATLSGGATTAFIRPLINYAIADGAAIDITLRIGLPQLELGAFATSVIPTTTTALTRSADVAAVNTLSPWYNASASTLYLEFTPVGLSSFGGQPFLEIDDGTTSERIRMLATSGNAMQNVTTVSSATSGSNTTPATTYVANTTYKVAAAIKLDDMQSFVNGISGTTDTTVLMPTGLTTLRFAANQNLGTLSNAWFRRFTYYPRRLSQAEGEAITA